MNRQHTVHQRMRRCLNWTDRFNAGSFERDLPLPVFPLNFKTRSACPKIVKRRNLNTAAPYNLRERKFVMKSQYLQENHWEFLRNLDKVILIVIQRDLVLHYIRKLLTMDLSFVHKQMWKNLTEVRPKQNSGDLRQVGLMSLEYHKVTETRGSITPAGRDLYPMNRDSNTKVEYKNARGGAGYGWELWYLPDNSYFLSVNYFITAVQ